MILGNLTALISIGSYQKTNDSCFYRVNMENVHQKLHDAPVTDIVIFI